MLSDSLLKLSDIKIAEDKKRKKSEWNKYTREQQNDILETIVANKGQVRTLFRLSLS